VRGDGRVGNLEEWLRQRPDSGRIAASRLENIQISYLTIPVPQLQQFMGRTENLRFHRAKFHIYSERVYVAVNSPEKANMSLAAFSINVDCWHLDSQVLYPPWPQFSMRSVKYSPRWSTSPLRTKFIVGHRKTTMRSTSPSGANFLPWARRGTLSLSSIGRWRASPGTFTRTAGAHIFREPQEYCIHVIH
jgi:hypothetical protein